MQAIRLEREVTDQQVTIRFPETFNAHNVEIIILPLKDQVPKESTQRMQAFDQTGFVREVLASKDEDVWNEL